MPQYKIKFNWEAIVNAADEDDALAAYWEGFDHSDETLDDVANDSVIIEEIKP